jgi:YD repeat-containing protein
VLSKSEREGMRGTSRITNGYRDAVSGKASTPRGQDAVGQWLAVTDTRRNLASFTWDASGRQTGTQDALGNRVTHHHKIEFRVHFQRGWQRHTGREGQWLSREFPASPSILVSNLGAIDPESRFEEVFPEARGYVQANLPWL